jgi:hypothetical protein
VVRKGETGHWAGDHKQTTVWDIPKNAKSETGHGTQKPVECMRRPIENNSSPGQAVYEPFSGSGTTIIAAEMTARVAHAIEITPAYVDVAVKRWQEFTGQQAVLDGDGRSFDDVAAQAAGVRERGSGLVLRVARDREIQPVAVAAHGGQFLFRQDPHDVDQRAVLHRARELHQPVDPHQSAADGAPGDFAEGLRGGGFALQRFEGCRENLLGDVGHCAASFASVAAAVSCAACTASRFSR